MIAVKPRQLSAPRRGEGKAMDTQGRRATTLVRIATVYLLFGLAVGMYVGISGQFAFISAHSHVSLVGWTTMALVGLAYLALPACERSRLAAVHFWLHNVGLPVMLGGLMFKAAGRDTAEPFVALGSALVLVAMLMFTINVFVNGAVESRLRAASPSRAARESDPAS